ncbi:MAG: BrnT family toxin, partial [Methylobacteriaceae bacterium]|nr:BrnT family toxin [Methylobacteriaceae bacterium]MBV9243191.1 BrnT family toxin [Methylobacteriaceae bacterium]
QVIGMAHGRVFFVVVMLPDEDTCRIISARKATRHEQNRYYSSNPASWGCHAER